MKTKLTRSLFLAAFCGLFAASAAPAVADTSLAPSAQYAVDIGRSHLDISGHDSVLGTHTLTFDRWSARIDTSATPARLVFDIEVASLRCNEPRVKSIIEKYLLEVAKYPHATFVATLTPSNVPGVITIDGTATIHGKTNPLRLSGQLQKEGTGYRFDATIDISRSAYDMKFAPAEAVLDDLIVITLSAVAFPEP